MTLYTTEPLKTLSRGSKETLEYMRTDDASDYTGLSASTLAKLRMRHRRCDGPRFLKISGCVLYRRTDLDDWLGGHIVDPSGRLDQQNG